MPYKKNNTKQRARAIGKRAPKIRTDIAISPRQESFLRAQALQDAGVYAPKKKLSGKRFTKDQAKYVNKLWKRVQSHGTFEHNKTVRPFKRTLKGYQLNKPFKIIKQKAARKITGSIPTHKGAIIDVRTAANIKVRKDGTITYRAKRFGKMTTIYRGTLSTDQALAFVRQVESGTFKMPMKWGTIYVFGHETMNSRFDFDNPDQLLKRFFKRYTNEITKLAFKYPDFHTITLEFFNA